VRNVLVFLMFLSCTRQVSWDALPAADVQRDWLTPHPLLAAWLINMRTLCPHWAQAHETHQAFALDKRNDFNRRGSARGAAMAQQQLQGARDIDAYADASAAEEGAGDDSVLSQL
jgi:hypothetical protein